jgi:UDP-3-O-[3-hydroxymyristoyl] glucosamine N-acyltransferase
MSKPLITVKDIHDLLGVGPTDDERSFTRLAAYEEAGLDSIVFAEDQKNFEKAMASGAGLILAPSDVSFQSSARVLQVAKPKHAFAVIGFWMFGSPDGTIHPSAVIDEKACVGYGTSIGAGCVIEAGAVIGEVCSIASNVTIYGNTRLGDSVVVQAGAVLGSMGFGYVRGSDGRYVRFPQQGRLVIEDDVEIGANTTIDRGALGETRIGRGTKIDNLVHVGHNCNIGCDVVIASQVGISGSTVVGDGAVLAGQVGLGDHVNVGPGVILGGQGGVFPGKTVNGPGEMFAGTPAEPVKEYLKGLARVRRLK